MKAPAPPPDPASVCPTLLSLHGLLQQKLSHALPVFQQLLGTFPQRVHQVGSVFVELHVEKEEPRETLEMKLMKKKKKKPFIDVVCQVMVKTRRTPSFNTHICFCAHPAQFLLVTSLSRKKSTNMRIRFPFGLLLPLRFARASSACGSCRLNNLPDRKSDGEKQSVSTRQILKTPKGKLSRS